MSPEWTTDVQPGYRTKVLKVGNCTIEIHRPILASEEQHRREAQVTEALKRFGKGIQDVQN